MRELKTLEVDKWVPSEKKSMVKHAGMISPQEAFDALEKHLNSNNMLPDEYFLSGARLWDGLQELPDYFRADCSVNWGGSEGIYLDIDLRYYDKDRNLCFLHLATGKTLGETGDDFLRMSRIAAECSMMLNGRGEIVRFYEEEKGRHAFEAEKAPLESVISACENSCHKSEKIVEKSFDDIER